jgi:glycosyltransferase involved in cell wall biosynthesis
MPVPFFSVIVPTYNRASEVTRCMESCFSQTFSDFEVILVDDGSTDDTTEVFKRSWDSRLRIVVHEANRGINPSRYSGVAYSRGEWIVVLDSDWELYPNALQRLHDIIHGFREDVRVIRSRLLWDDGHISPAFVPAGPIGYEERIRWVEAEGGNDAGWCLHRSVFATAPFIRNRRGAMETLHDLNLQREWKALYIEDVLGREHTDAANSYLRSIDRRELIPRLLRDAPDMLWMAETTLREHGAALKRHGPRQYRELIRVAAREAFLTGDRRKGLQYSLRYLGLSKWDLMLWGTLSLGLVGPRNLAYGTLIYRIMTRK